MKISDKGLELIKEFEGLKLEAYRCSAGVATIGYGSTRGVKMGTTITEAEATELLRNDVGDAEDCVNQSVLVALTQGQFDSLTSFVFNLGCGAFKGSTLLALLNAGKTDAVPAQFHRWTKAAGRELPGLVRRRKAEAELFCA